GESRPRCFSSFFSLRWAMYLDMAALNSRPVNFVPLTISVKVLFSTSSCIGHRLLSTDFAGVALDTKAGPPAAAAGISAWQAPFSEAGRSGHSIDGPGALWHG